MTYNPSRLENRAQQNRVPPPGSGVSHSDIVRARSRNALAPEGDRTHTPIGHSVALFRCEAFETRFETLFPRCTTGVGVNHTGDRDVTVVRGTLFVTVMADAAAAGETFQLREGQHKSLPRGTMHTFASSGDIGTEFHVTETVGYAETWEQLTSPEVGEHKGRQPDVLRPAPILVPRVQDPTALANAQAAQVDWRARRQPQPDGQARSTVPTNANSINVPGVNPRPIIPIE